MIKTEKMNKIRMIIANNYLPEVINQLYELTVLHVITHKKTEELDIASPLAENKRIAEIVLKIKAIITNYKVQEIKTQKEDMNKEEIINTEKKVNTLIEKLSTREQEIQKITAAIQQKKEILQQIEVLNSLYLDLESYEKINSLAMFVGYINHNDDIKEKLNIITTRYKLHLSRNGKNKTIALFCDKNKEKEIESVLKQYSFEPIKTDLIAGLFGSPLNQSTKLHKELMQLEHQLQKKQQTISNIITEETHFLKETEFLLEIESKKAEIPLSFARTEKTTIITGWIPKKATAQITAEIEQITKKTAVIEELEIEKKEKIPIKLKNNLLVKPFEFFLNLYTLPNYKEIDPSFLLFITFPLFFGFMLGDVGYGIVTLLLFWYLKKKMPTAKNLLNVMIIASIISIAFGFVFGEYFGFEGVSEIIGEKLLQAGIPLHKTIMDNEIIYQFPHLISRMHGKIELLGHNIHIVLIIGALVGLIHLNLALLIGFLNEFMAHGFITAVFEKISWIILEIGLFLLAAPYLHLFLFPIYASIIIILIAIIMIYKGEGIQGLVELPALFSTILSYLRLGAVGLAGVGLAVVINENLAMPFLQKGGLYIIPAILILIAGHTINIALSVIGPFLHSLRLHYVEFFSRFFKGGGIAYKPFGKIKEE